MRAQLSDVFPVEFDLPRLKLPRARFCVYYVGFGQGLLAKKRSFFVESPISATAERSVVYVAKEVHITHS